jgi:hypothetical protein
MKFVFILLLFLLCLPINAAVEEWIEVGSTSDVCDLNHSFKALSLEHWDTPENIFQLWRDGVVPVELKNFTYREREMFIARVNETFGQIPSRISFDFNGSVANGGISIVMMEPPYSQFNTNYFTAFKSAKFLGVYDDLLPYSLSSAKISRYWIEQYPEDKKDIVFLNATLHEFFHCLFYKNHMTNYYGKVPTALMNTYLSSDKLRWSESDKRQYKEMYGRYGKKLVFNEEDIGKDCVLIYQKKKDSVSFKITETEMYVPFLKSGRFKIRVVD